MVKNFAKLFVVPSLYLIEIKDYIKRNYGNFPIIYLNFEYHKKLKMWRLIVEMKSEPISFIIVSFRSVWLSSSRFFYEYNNLKRFISDVDEKPF